MLRKLMVMANVMLYFCKSEYFTRHKIIWENITTKQPSMIYI